MSISAPEAHHVHALPEKIIRGAEDYVNDFADLDDVLHTDTPATAQAAHAVFHIEENRDEARARAADHLRTLRPGEQARGIQLARTALVTSMAGELVQRAHDPDATPESRRLAIELASAAPGRHFDNIQRQRGITRRHT